MSITIHFKADEDVVRDFDEVFARSSTRYRTRSDFLRSMMEDFIAQHKEPKTERSEPRVVKGEQGEEAFIPMSPTSPKKYTGTIGSGKGPQ